MTTQLSSRNWFGKASAGLVLGLAIALGASGLLAAALDLKETNFSLPGQVTMWMMGPVWSFILAFCFLFRSGLRAWTVLGAAAGIIWLVLFCMGKVA